MKKPFFYSVLLCVTLSFSQSKPFEISGTLVSEDDQSPLESATVYLQRVQDSSLITYSISDKDGKFMLEEKSGDKEANFYVSYVGYQTYFKAINLDKSQINLGDINLKVSTNALNEIVIESQAPVTIKKDTLEFNVKSFDTKKDANIEDLLKELPGVEVDPDGSIKVNGKPVNKILVNGKPFFGDDPTIATRNLSKDIIEKIQVSDTKTKGEAFAGEQGDQENKTVNLVIKEENNKGNFGRVAAGVGTNKRYEYAGMFNRFNNDQRLSVLAGGNNINSPGFSYGEINKMFGGGNDIYRNVGGYRQGVTESKSAGANYADQWGKEVDMSGSYFYSGADTENDVKSNRENILTDTRYFTAYTENSFNDEDNHSVNMEYDIKVDSTLLINIKPSLRYSKSNNFRQTEEASFDETKVLTNESNSSTIAENTGTNFNTNISATKRLGSKGSFLKLDVTKGINKTDTDDFFKSETNIYGNAPSDIVRDQFRDGENTDDNFETKITARVPLKANKLFLDLAYQYRKNKIENKNSSFDFDDVAQDYNQFNSDLSTDLEYINETGMPGITLEYRGEKLSTTLETKYVFRNLESTDFLRPEFSLQRNFDALEMNYSVNYRFSQKAQLRFFYQLNNDPPLLSQVQSFKNVTNPLNTIVGNPNLKPNNDHNISLNYNGYDFQKGTGLYGYVSANFYQDQIVSKTTINDDLIRETTYANVNGARNLYGYLSKSKQVKVDSLRSVNINLGFNFNSSKSINFNNGTKYSSNVNSIGPNLGARFMWKDVMEFGAYYNLDYTKNTYDLDGFEDENFMAHNLFLNTATFLPKGFEWRNNIRYNCNPNIAPGFNKSAWFWNSTLAYSVLKDQGTLTLKVYDLLNQNTNARRTATQNYIEDIETKVLKQYFMLSFSWKFNTLGKAGEINDRGGYIMY